jgi:formylglycine-generating enzyme required for sulfatase activity
VDLRADDDETPPHRVSIRGFQMGKTEVTREQYMTFVKATGRSEPGDAFMSFNAYGDQVPVVRVSWYDVQAFIAWLNSVDGGGYRLPTEAEWEYACRAGGKHDFCGSDKVEDVAWYLGNGSDRPHPVARKDANAFGLHDMSGNAAEMTQDCWHYTYRAAPNDGSAWLTGCEGDARRVRGGSFATNAKNTRASARLILTAGERPETIGFRLVRQR